MSRAGRIDRAGGGGIKRRVVWSLVSAVLGAGLLGSGWYVGEQRGIGLPSWLRWLGDLPFGAGTQSFLLIVLGVTGGLIAIAVHAVRSRRGLTAVVYGILGLDVLLGASTVLLAVDDEDWPEPLRWIPTEPILAFLIVSLAELILIASVAVATRGTRQAVPGEDCGKS